MASIGVAIINYNRLEMLQRCIRSVLETHAGVVFDLLVWDAGSTDGSIAWLESEALGSLKGHIVYFDSPPATPPPRSYAEAVNDAARRLFAEHPEIVYYYPLNNDNYVHRGWLSTCVDAFGQDQRIGHVGSSVWYGPSFPRLAAKVQSAGAFFLHDGREWQTRSAFVGQSHIPCWAAYDVDYSGFGMYRRDLFEKFGGLCEDYPPIYWDDPDWGFTLWVAGYRVVCAPLSMIVHDHGPNPYSEAERQHHFAAIGPNKAKFMAKWVQMLRPDGTRSPCLPRPQGCLGQ